jgi:hypothetical protein
MAPAYPKKPNPAPPKKMRQFFWDKIPDTQREKTIWKTLDDGDIDLDMQELLNNFQAAEVKLPQKEATADSVMKTVDLVNPSKSKTVFIMMKSIKMPGAVIASELLGMSSRIDLDHLASLRTCLPDEADFDAINQYDGPKELLGECERFYLAIKHVSLLPLRVDLLLKSAEVERDMNEMIKQMDSFCRGIHQLASSPALRGILTLILRIGNFLNGGSPRGGAYGFKIEFLTKLKDIRSSEPGFTFIHLIAKLVNETMPPLQNICQELDQVAPASMVDLEHAKSTVVKYRSLIGQCNAQMDAMSMLMVDDGLPKFVERFVGTATPLVLTFEHQYSEGIALFEEFRNQYGEAAMTPDEFFRPFATFLQHYNQAIRELKEKDGTKK